MDAEGNLVYLPLPPEPFTSTVNIHPQTGELSTDFSMSNSDYWQAVQASTTGYAVEHTFVVESKRYLYLPLLQK